MKLDTLEITPDEATERLAEYAKQMTGERTAVGAGRAHRPRRPVMEPLDLAIV